jgi:hypothetical protein
LDTLTSVREKVIHPVPRCRQPGTLSGVRAYLNRNLGKEAGAES